MVHYVRTPEMAKRLFTPNELCGWQDGIKYSFQMKKGRRKKAVHFVPDQPPPPVQIVSGGKPVPTVKLPF